MTPEQFCYFLYGAIEVGRLKSINEDRVKELHEILSHVLTKHKCFQKQFTFPNDNN